MLAFQGAKGPEKPFGSMEHNKNQALPTSWTPRRGLIDVKMWVVSLLQDRRSRSSHQSSRFSTKIPPIFQFSIPLPLKFPLFKTTHPSSSGCEPWACHKNQSEIAFPEHVCNPPVKLTVCPWKLMLGRLFPSSLLGQARPWGKLAVSFRECKVLLQPRSGGLLPLGADPQVIWLSTSNLQILRKNCRLATNHGNLRVHPLNATFTHQKIAGLVRGLLRDNDG